MAAGERRPSRASALDRQRHEQNRRFVEAASDQNSVYNADNIDNNITSSSSNNNAVSPALQLENPYPGFEPVDSAFGLWEVEVGLYHTMIMLSTSYVAG